VASAANEYPQLYSEQRISEAMMKCEPIDYTAEGLNFEGQLIYSESDRNVPLLLMAPNWLGVTPAELGPIDGTAA
jgi:hypothetical protein